MIPKLFYLIFFLCLFSCKTNPTPNNDENDISDISTKEFREFKVEDSKYIDVDEMWKPFEDDMKAFTIEDYNTLKPLIFDQDIPTIQKHVQEGKLTYENLTKFYLYRIKKYDRENDKSLNSVISLNPNIIKEAKAKDVQLQMEEAERETSYSVFGMPILLKDNINAQGLVTTAGAVALMNNKTNNAFIVSQLEQQGALILGKANLSEWAYFFCGDCPSGYSAVGGQTFNPYGRKTIDTGGSSSGSAVAVAANFCVAAVGSETSGSILSPSSQNAAVGLKPTIGLLSRGGIVPISSTLDTAGPITRNVIDNAIVLDAMFGFDKYDDKSINPKWHKSYYSNSLNANIRGKRFGVFNGLLEDSLYVKAVNRIKSEGAIIVKIDEEDVDLPGFLRLLNLDMKKDLPSYFRSYANKEIPFRRVFDIIEYNNLDSLNTAPYGQKLFKGIVEDSATDEEFKKIKEILHRNGRMYFDKPMREHQLDGFLSINNYHAGYAAVAEYPAITVPMGFEENGAPKGLTFIARPLQERMMYKWALAFEKVTNHRISPKEYQ